MDAIVLPLPLQQLKPFAAKDDKTHTKFRELDLYSIQWQSIVDIYYNKLEALEDLRNNNPGALPEETRKIIGAVLTQFDSVMKTEAAKVRAIPSVGRWLEGDDDVLTVLVDCTIDLDLEMGGYTAKEFLGWTQ